jgi:hypothetical protein
VRGADHVVLDILGVDRPRIFGALLEGVSAALRNADSVRLERKPRMADFAVRATAMEFAFGWEPGSFAEAYEANRREASEVLLGNEPLVDAIEALLNRIEEDEQGHRKRKVKTLRRPLRDYERSEDPAEENRKEEITDDRTPEGEERLTGNPFDFEFDFGGDSVGNPFASDDNEANDPEGQGEEREH